MVFLLKIFLFISISENCKWILVDSSEAFNEYSPTYETKRIFPILFDNNNINNVPINDRR